jgi:hypothetical protein
MKLSFSVTCARALRIAQVATALLPVRSPAQTLEEALDSPPGWTWTTSATAADGSTPVPGGVWTGQTAVTHDGVDAARSGTLPLYGTAKLRTESITGPGTVIFWRRHGRSYEENPFAIVANGVNVGPFLPGGTWQPVAIDYPSGPGTLEFGWYNTDSAGTEPDNHAYVDEVAFQSTTGAPQFLPDPPPDLTVGEGYTIQPPIALLGEKPMMLETTPAGQTWTNSTTLEAPAPGSPPRHSGWPFGLEATPARSGTWTVTASNALGSVTRTFNVIVVPAAPHSIGIDGPGSAWAGATVRLTAQPRGTAPFTYQWKKDGTPLAGKTDQTLEITGFSAADEGNYTVEVTNGLGSRESGAHSIVLGNDPPTLVSQSGNVDQALFGFDSLQVEVTGTPPFNTEWRKDGQVIESNNGVSDGSGWRSLSGDPSDTPGVYVFRSANGLGEVVSAPMVVQVGEGVGIADGLDNTNVGWRYPYTGSPGWHRQTTETHDGTDAVALLNSDPTPLRTAVEGPAVVSFWWRVQDGTLDFSVDGTVAATLSSPGSDSGWQEVNVSLGAGWHELEWQTQSWTPAAWLDQFTALGGSGGPVLVSQPVGGNYSFGDPVTLSVTVTGTGPFDYRLFRDDDPTPVQEALGQTATTFDFTLFADFSTPGAYWIEITDAASRTAASDDAVISVNGDFGSLINLATAVGQPTLTWSYTDFSVSDGNTYPIRAWYRTRQDGVAPGAESSARTPALNAGEMAAVVMQYDSGVPTPTRLRFWARAAGANLGDVLFVGVNGTLATLTPAGTTTGASGETWTAYDVMLSGGLSEVQFEALPVVNGVAVWLDRIEFTPATPPVITQQPVPLTLPAGESGGLSVTATSPVPVTYQWFKTGTGALAGQTNDVLTFPTIAAGDAGQYYVEVSNEFGTTTSATVTVTVTGPRPQITQPLQPQQLSPGDDLSLQVAAASSNGPLTYRWYRNGVLVQTGGTTFQRTNVTTADHGLYRVEVSDPYYTTSSQAQVTVSVLYYHLTVLLPVETNGFAVATAINNTGVVAGYWGSVGKVPADVSAVVWQNAVPTRMTPSGSSFNWSWSINNHGQAAGELLGLDRGAQKGVVRWSPPYATGVFDNLGYPTGATLMEFSRINDAGVIAATDSGMGFFGSPRFAYRYTTAGVWELLGSLTGATPLRGAVDRGWATALDINNAGVIVGNTYFLEAGLTETNNIPTQTTGWFFDPARPGQRTAMDTLSPDLALSPAQPWGWIDSVNDLGDMAARRYGAGSPTKLFLIQANGTVTKLLERPPRTAVPDDESFNVDALNNRREMVGYYHVPDGQHAALIRSRGTPPGGTPSALNDFELYDLNDLVLGGTGGYVLRLANDINDQGQIVGEMTRPGENTVGFLLTPVTAYTGMAALAVDDVIVRRAGQSLRFSGASLTRNDHGTPPLSLDSVAGTSMGGGTIIGPDADGWYRYTPPAGPDAPDNFTYVVRAGDGSTDTGTVRVLIEAEPPTSENQLPIQLLPGGEVRVRFVGIPGRTYHIEVASAVEGPWTRVATVVAGPTGLVEYQETPPPGGSRFYRMVE